MEKAELARKVQEACYLEGDFVLRSGQAANFYFDKYRFEADPSLLSAVAQFAAPLIPPGTEILAGLELGGVPISTALSLLTGLPQVMVRKQAKTYGTAKLAEGPDIAGRRLLIVEDVVTTGGQVVLSAQDLRARGGEVSSVLCIIDRRPPTANGPGGGPGAGATGQEDKLQAAGLQLVPLFGLDDLLPAPRA
ncbi:MAG TPA: orotate phosphoribosyltransferase [Acidimicrobiales bacterium]|nr:orotate phosphoribosyltransferase [Acidimicrobiales bacterium]